MIQQTSISAFELINNISKRRQQVYDTICRINPNGTTDKQISQWLNRPINTITPRRNELMKLRIIEKAGTVKQDGRQAIIWRIV